MNKIFTVILLCLGFVTSMSAQALSFNANTANTSITIGDTVIVDVTASNFVGIEYFQYTMEWDPTKVELITIADCNTDINLNCILGTSNFNETSPGVMRVSWFDGTTQGVTIPDASKLFSIRLKAIADGDMNLRFSDNGLSREAEGDNGLFEGNQLQTSTSGQVAVGSTNTGGGNGTAGDLGFIVGSLTGEVGTESCVPVTVANFDSVIYYQYTMEWDASILELVRLQNCNTGIALNCTLGQTNFNETSPGVLRHNWIDQATVGKDIADDATLFEMCFDLKTAGSSNISITESGLSLEGETVGAGEIDANDIDITNGTATVTSSSNGGGNNGGGTTVGDLGFTVGSLTGEVGTESCVPVTVANFDSVIYYQYTMEWDASILELVRLQNCNTGIALNCTLGQTNFNETSPGVLRHNWIDQATVGKDIADDATLFEMCFDLKTAGSSNISITESGLSLEGETVGAGEIDANDIDITNGTATVTSSSNGGGNNGGGTTVGDLGFTVGNLTGEVGTESCVPVTVTNFDSVIFYQYTMEWDASIIELVRLQNCNADIALNCTLGQTSFNETSPGVLRASWLEQATVGANLADDTVLFELCYDLKSAGNSNISFSNNGLTIEAETQAAGEIDDSVINTTNGTATVTSSSNGGGNNGGGTTVGDLGFTVGSLTGVVGTEECVPVTVTNFDSVIFYQYTMEWDASIIELVRLQNCNADIALNCTLGQTSFNETSPGVLRASWLDNATVGDDLADDAVLFELCYDLKAAGNSSISFTNSGLTIEAETQAAGEIDDSVINTTNGTATVTSSSNGGGNNGGGTTVGDLGFTVGSLTGEVGTESCVPVTVTNFDSVIFYQYTMEWDASIIELTRLQNCNTDIALNCTLGQTSFNETSPGVLRASWLEQATVGADLADDAVLFELCYDLKSAGNSNISFSNNGLTIEAETQAAGEIDDSVINTTNGTATVTSSSNGGGNNGGGTTVGDLGFTVGSLTGEVGTESCVPVTVTNFDSVIFYQYTMEWDASIIELVRLQNCNTDIALNCTLGQTSFNETSPGVLRASWLEQATVGASLADDAVLFELCYDLKSAGNSNISFSNNGLTIEAETQAAGEIDDSVINTTNGTATVTSSSNGGGGNNGGGNTVGDLGFTVGSLTGEVGTESCVPVTVTNFDSVIFYQYTMEWDASVIELVRLQNCNTDIALNCTLGQTSFNETSPGVLRASWLEQATVGASLADDAVLFELCYDLKSAGNSNISFSNNGLTIEAETQAAGEIDDSVINTTNGTATVTSSSNGGGGNNGGGTTVGDLGFTVGSLTGEVGTESCVPVTVTNFDSVIFYQYTMEWDASVIELVRLQNCNTDIALNCTLGQTSFNETSPGVLRASWLEQATVGADLADDAVLFELCYDLKSAGNSNISFSNNGLTIEAETQAAGEIDDSVINTTNGTATVTSSGNGGGGNNGGGNTVGDLGFTVGSLTGEVGTESCVPVTVTNFDSVIFYQYTMEWDASIIELVRLQNCNTDIALNCTLGQTSFNETSPGVLRASWLDNATVGDDLADDAVLFELCYDLKAAGNSSISFTNSGLTIEAETQAAGEIDDSVINTTNGTATVTSSSNGGGNNGGGTTVGDLGFTVGSLTGEVGTESCVPVTVTNFDSVIFYQYTMEWDASIIELVRLQNCNTDIALNCTLGQTSFNETSPGVLRASWLEQATVGVDLADDAVLFELCYDLKSAGNSNISFSNNGLTIEAETQAAGEIDDSVINTTNGTATVTSSSNGGGNGNGGGGATGPLKFSTTSANVEAGSSTCLNVMVDNFVDITTFTLSQTWDASLFELEGVMACNAALTGLNCGLGNANFTLVGNNRVDITWTDASGTGVTILSMEPLFQLCFKAIGDPGSGTNIAYGTNISASNTDGAITPSDIETQDAQISISGLTNNGQLTFIASSEMGDVGETVCVQVTTENFDDIVFFQYTMEWDSTVLELVNLNACNTDLDLNCTLAQTHFNQTSGGSMRASWTDLATVGKSVADGALLYEMCFKIIGEGGESSLVRFTSNEIVIEAQDDVDFIDEDDVVIQNGLVSANDNGGNITPNLIFNISEEIGRQSDTVCVAVTADNFDDIIHFQYNIEWNSAVLQFIGVDACNSKLDGLSCVEGSNSTTFNLTAPGILRTSWIHAPTTGATLTSEDTLFVLCFKLVGNSGASSAVQITDSQLDIEASNPDGDLSPNNILINNGMINIVTVMPVASIDNINQTDVLCNGESTGAIDIDISGGVAPLTYNWSNGATTQDISNVAAGMYRVSITDAEDRVIISDPIQLFESAAMAISNIQVTQPNAETNVQGAIDIAVSGGTSPYTFVWSNGTTSEDISGLAAGCYTVTITDRNGCTFTPSEICVEEEVTALAALNTNSGNVICPTDANGSIAFSFNGGVAPFTYTLSTGAMLNSSTRSGTFSDLPIGDYTILVTDAENTSITGSASVDFTSTFFVEGGVVTLYNGFDVSGFGNNDATITASPNGTVGPYTYLWSDNLGTSNVVPNVGAGTYSVTITDGSGCVQSTIITVNQPQQLVANATADLMPGCNSVCEGEASVNVQGGVAPYTFLWSTGSTQGVLFDLCSGDYTVSVTDANSVTTVSSITVVEPDSLVLTLDATAPTSVAGTDGSARVTATGGTAPYSYQWNDANGSKTPEVTGLAPNTYFVIVTDANGCQQIGMVDVPLAIVDCFESRNIITIDGDGMNENLIIQCADQVQNTFQVFNRWGQLVFDATNYDNSWEGTDRRGNQLPEGGYFWVLRVSDNGVITEYKNHVTIVTAE